MAKCVNTHCFNFGQNVNTDGPNCPRCNTPLVIQENHERGATWSWRGLAVIAIAILAFFVIVFFVVKELTLAKTKESQTESSPLPISVQEGSVISSIQNQPPNSVGLPPPPTKKVTAMKAAVIKERSGLCRDDDKPCNDVCPGGKESCIKKNYPELLFEK